MINNKVTQKIVKRTHPPGLEIRNPTVIKKSNKQKPTVIEPNGEK